MQKTIKQNHPLFSAVGYAEGISLLVLLAIAMPLKYLAGYPLAVIYGLGTRSSICNVSGFGLMGERAVQLAIPLPDLRISGRILPFWNFLF
nr:DUF3817 domain-containing protein [Sediminibacterium sp. C3]